MANPDIPREAPLPSPQEYQKEVYNEAYKWTTKFLEGVLSGGKENEDDIMFCLNSLVKNRNITLYDKNLIITFLDIDNLKMKGVVMKDGSIDIVRLKQFVENLSVEDLRNLKLLADEIEKYKQ